MIVGRVPPGGLGHVGSLRWAVHNCETGGDIAAEKQRVGCIAFARAAPQLAATNWRCALLLMIDWSHRTAPFLSLRKRFHKG